MRCPACGVEVVEQAVYCHKCGERIEPAGGDVADSAAAVDSASRTPAELFNHAANGRPDEPEQEIWRGGYSPKAMIGAWIASGLVSVLFLAGGIFWARSGTAWGILAALIVLPWLYNAAVLGYRRFSVRYVLTTQRFIHESGLLRRVNDRIEVLDMDDISFEQGAIERLVGVGTIRIVSSDRSHPDLTLPGIENIQGVSELFDNARRAERRRRGVHIEQI